MFQAVDAGTGDALADERMTVRYLVRAPITLDSSVVERVPSSEPYRVAHAVGSDSLVVEVRLEAPSYHRLDTALAVARGASAGPFTLRMARKLRRVARREEPAGRPIAGRPGGAPSSASSLSRTERPAAAARPRPATRPTGPPPDPDATADRRPLQAGNQAYDRRDWAAATAAYQRMQSPRSRTSSYAREYARALVRQGISHARLGEWAGALDALEEATRYGTTGYTAYLHLGQAQCAVGRVDAGRESLARVERLQATIPAAERPEALALVSYQKAMCSYRQFEAARNPRQVLRAGGSTVKELEAFLDRAADVASPSPELEDAASDARERIQRIRDRVRRGGVGGDAGGSAPG